MICGLNFNLPVIFCNVISFQSSSFIATIEIKSMCLYQALKLLSSRSLDSINATFKHIARQDTLKFTFVNTVCASFVHMGHLQGPMKLHLMCNTKRAV